MNLILVTTMQSLLVNSDKLEHPYYTRSGWISELARDFTRTSYEQWVAEQLDENGGIETHCAKCGIPLLAFSAEGSLPACIDDNGHFSVLDAVLELDANIQRLMAEAIAHYNFGEDILESVGDLVCESFYSWTCTVVLTNKSNPDSGPILKTFTLELNPKLEGDRKFAVSVH